MQMATSDSLSQIITKKLEKLYHKFNWIIKAEVFLKLGNSTSPEKQICEIELSAPGPRLFATSTSTNFEKAAVATIKDLERQLRKRKQILKSH